MYFLVEVVTTTQVKNSLNTSLMVHQGTYSNFEILGDKIKIIQNFKDINCN